LILPKDELATLVLELGNKQNRSGLYRDWYLEQGCQYTSVDWNGRDGAVAWDMRYSLNVKTDLGQEPFDLVTNFGFTEHVTEQEPVWRNIHDAVKVGGAVVCCLPFPYLGYEKRNPNWERHGYWHPTIKWMEALSQANRYEVSFICAWSTRVRPTLISRWYKVRQDPFVWVDEPMHRTSLEFRSVDLRGPK
jgi:SAM-dependent methyltransferase